MDHHRGADLGRTPPKDAQPTREVMRLKKPEGNMRPVARRVDAVVVIGAQAFGTVKPRLGRSGAIDNSLQSAAA